MFIYFEKRRAKDLREAIENGCAVPLEADDLQEVIDEMEHEGVIGLYTFYEISFKCSQPVPRPTVTGCSYGSHNMVYVHDERGKVVASKCGDCGAEYQGFHL